MPTEVVGYADGSWGVWIGEGTAQDLIYVGDWPNAMDVARECDCQWDGGWNGDDDDQEDGGEWQHD